MSVDNEETARNLKRSRDTQSGRKKKKVRFSSQDSISSNESPLLGEIIEDASIQEVVIVPRETFYTEPHIPFTNKYDAYVNNAVIISRNSDVVTQNPYELVAHYGGMARVPVGSLRVGVIMGIYNNEEDANRFQNILRRLTNPIETQIQGNIFRGKKLYYLIISNRVLGNFSFPLNFFH